MKYARAHIKRYWAFQNRRALGISFLSFGVMFGISVIFAVLFNQLFIVNPVSLFLVWILLLALAAIVMIVSLSLAHVHVANVMNDLEKMEHSKHVGWFLIVMFFAVFFFMLPIIFIPEATSLLILFSIGGILMVFYLATSLIFDHRYHEIAMASLLIWASFLLAFFTMWPQYYANPPLFESASFLVASTAIVVVFSMTGMAMLVHSSNEFVNEFKKIYKIK